MLQGRNVSGRVWKAVRLEKSSAMKKGNGSNLGWEKRQLRLQQHIQAKTIEKELIDDRIKKKQDAKARRIEREKKKEENEKKAEIVQKISAAKLRRMKKKQLRNLKKA